MALSAYRGWELELNAGGWRFWALGGVRYFKTAALAVKQALEIKHLD